MRKTNSHIDIVGWRERIAEIEGQVCRIQVVGDGRVGHGTGFLDAADLVLTNYHVMEPVIDFEARPRRPNPPTARV